MKRIFLFILSLTLLSPSLSYASTTDGTVDTTNRYAWSENAGWLDFGTILGAVHVTDTALTGYAYGENIGWISLNCSNTSSCGTNAYAVTNDSSGTLSGYAWSENTGWINFAPTLGGVTISSSGVFSGYAYSENTGWISFATDYPVTTDWRPTSARASATPTPAPVAFSMPMGGSVSVDELARLLTPSPAATAYLNSLRSRKVAASMPPVSFSRDLGLGMTGPDVKTLQVYLNTRGFVIATTGPGSLGHETMTFGILTKAALAKFQAANGITPAIGYLGSKTRARIAMI